MCSTHFCITRSSHVLVHTACESNDVDMCLGLVLEDPRLVQARCRKSGDDRLTPLHVAAGFGATECVAVLLEYNHNVNELDGKGRGALQYACAWGQTDTVSLLLQNGASINLQDSEGLTPLMDAIKYKQPHTVQLLLAEPTIDVNIPDERGVSAFHLAVKHRIPADKSPKTASSKDSKTLYSSLDVLTALLEKGARSMYDDDGRTPLHWYV
jgi:ankyrin repeat protein